MELVAIPPDINPKPHNESAGLAYVVSSRYGFGHSSRAVAIAQELEPAQRITFIARGGPWHSFIRDNLAEYAPEISFAEPEYEKYTPDAQYEAQNSHLMDAFASSRMVLNDFHLQMPALKTLIEQSGVVIPFVGVYHSISGFESDNPEVQEFQEHFMHLAQNLDYLFVSEPAVEHSEPYELASGTVVIPCPPIVRRPTLHSDIVKSQLGLSKSEEFIYVTGGGLTAGEDLEKVVASLQQISINGLRLVMGRFNGLDQNLAEANGVVCIDPRPDGHNVIAASSGVITKPGMGTISEAIASAKPILLTDFPTPEGRAKYAMFKKLLGPSLPYRLDSAKEILPQIEYWLRSSDYIKQRLEEIPSNGAHIVATRLSQL